MIIRKTIIHNSGGYGNDPRASTKHLTFEDIEQAHKERWSFRSTLGFYGGYTFVIEADGTLKQARAIGEMGAHTRGHNDSIGICVVGNFTNGVDSPTDAQIVSLTKLLQNLIHSNFADYNVILGTRLHLNTTRILPHRFYGRTSCYGTGLSDLLARDLLRVAKTPQGLTVMEKLSIMQKAVETLQKVLLAFKRQQSFGSHGHSCWMNNERG